MITIVWPDFLHRSLQFSKEWAFAHVLVPANFIQLGILALIIVVSLPAGRTLRNSFLARTAGRFDKRLVLGNLARTCLGLLPHLLAIVLIWIGIVVFRQIYGAAFVLSLAGSLLVAWALIKIVTAVILDRFWARFIAVAAWSIAALNILNLLAPAAHFLNGIGFTLGGIRVSVLSILKALVILLALFRIAKWIGDYLERSFRNISGFSPTTSVLLIKITRIVLFVVICIVALTSIGVDFTALAVFTGAAGVGIGFGLQKVIGNLVSGIILLMDKSIKPGDVIQVGDVYGWISELRARFVSVVTREGKEYLIPNEDLITQQVVNWSFSNQEIRLNVPIGISYKADPKKAIALVLEIAGRTERVLPEPKPICLLTGFGESSVDLELRFWINDPRNGIANIKSRILLEVWDKFHEHGIEIPFPQRDVHLDAPSVSRLGELGK